MEPLLFFQLGRTNKKPPVYLSVTPEKNAKANHTPPKNLINVQNLSFVVKGPAQYFGKYPHSYSSLIILTVLVSTDLLTNPNMDKEVE